MTQTSTSGRVGLIGVGAIASSMVTGLSGLDRPPTIQLSPRNADVAQKLAARFANVEVSASNEDVVRGSDLVIVAVRPVDWVPVVESLPWRATQAAVSVLAGVSHAELAGAISPVRSLSRAIPLPGVAERTGMTAVWSTDSDVRSLFELLGEVVQVETEDALNALSAASGTMAATLHFTQTVAAWLQDRGMSQAAAERYVAAIQPDVSGVGLSATFDELIDEFSTPGGLNEELNRRMGEAGTWTDLRHGLDALLDRVQPD
ncbi:pyrroline-5-carboxylate reductase [Aeromicrobium panaciterrae]|uniref:NAD(P)-binding domain-containing protein n=1 Tax=Aeromicrobium panaciterrae TaxID=363861 RepID=UPI0031E072EB